jgi:predicted ATP-dependent protease
VVDIIRQASFWAEQAGNDLVAASQVKKAIDEKIFRSNRIEKIIQEMIEEETILIDTTGSVAGQVNGISVLPLGDYSFGKPSRITARTYVGSKGILNIDRETELGGPIHNKGSMILAGYLGGRYAEDIPLPFQPVLPLSSSMKVLKVIQLHPLSCMPSFQAFPVSRSVRIWRSPVL